MKIGITGGSGFVGSWTAQRAVEMGHQVVLLDRHGYLEGMAGRLIEQKTASLFLGDVRDATAMAELAAHVDGIIHLAACLGTQETIHNPFPPVETNILGGLHFLEGCARYDIPGTYIGVGNHWMNNPYSISKTTIERFVHMYNRERGTRVNIVRAVNAYGPGQSVAAPYGPSKVRKITPSFACRALTGTPIEVYGDGKQVSDMVHVSDVATALVRALETAAEGRTLLNPVEIGPARSNTVLDVAEMVLDAAGMWHAMHGGQPWKRPDIVHLPMRPGEIAGDRVTADYTTLEAIGMSHRDLISLEAGISATVRWFAENWLPGWQAGTAVSIPAQRKPAVEENPANVRMSDLADSQAIGRAIDGLFPASVPEVFQAEQRGPVATATHCCTAECNPGNCEKVDF